jgi:hypothetical protein
MKGELADHKHFSPDIKQRMVHDAILVAEYPEPGYFPAEPFNILFPVSILDPKKNEQSGSDGCSDFSINGNTGLTDLLNYCPHNRDYLKTESSTPVL